MNQMDYILYHANCSDGTTAALIAMEALGRENCTCLPVKYGDPPPEMPCARNVYIVDFSYPRGILDNILEHISGRLVVLDHHKTAVFDLIGESQSFLGTLGDGRLLLYLDTKLSGAQLAMIHFNQMHRKDLVALSNYVADRDLWKWKLTYSREVSEVISNVNLSDFDESAESLLSIAERLGDDEEFNDLVAEGSALRCRTRRLIEEHLEDVRSFVWSLSPEVTQHTKVVCCTAKRIVSELGHEMCKSSPLVALVWSPLPDTEEITCSLRSAEEGPDVSAIARTYGGGGHPHAAGFRTTWGNRPW